jgi:hypothetical protein
MIAAGRADKARTCPDRQHDLAVSYQKLGEALEKQQDGSGRPEALITYNQSLAVRKLLVNDRSAPGSWERELAQNYLRIAN